MELSAEQIYSLARSDIHFPACFPELARIEIVPLEPPRRDQPRQQRSKETAGKEPVLALQISEAQVTRFILLGEVRSVFLPYDADTANLRLDDGLWLIGPQIQDAQSLAGPKKAVAGKNPEGLGIVFVSESARVLNIVSIAASAEESASIRARITRITCCGGGPVC